MLTWLFHMRNHTIRHTVKISEQVKSVIGYFSNSLLYYSVSNERHSLEFVLCSKVRVKSQQFCFCVKPCPQWRL